MSSQWPAPKPYRASCRAQPECTLACHRVLRQGEAVSLQIAQIGDGPEFLTSSGEFGGNQKGFGAVPAELRLFVHLSMPRQIIDPVRRFHARRT